VAEELCRISTKPKNAKIPEVSRLFHLRGEDRVTPREMLRRVIIILFEVPMPIGAEN